MRILLLVQAAIVGIFLTMRGLVAGSIISVAARLVVIAARNEHVTKAFKATMRGAYQALVRHIKKTYG